MKHKRLSIIGPEPVSLSEARRQCFVTKDTEDENNHLNRLIRAARQFAEGELWRAIVPANYITFSDFWPAEIELPYPPMIEVDKIEYINPSGALVELDLSEVEIDHLSEPARIKPVTSWPEIKKDVYNAIRITYKAGYLKVVEGEGPNENNAPEGIKSAILMMVKHFHDNPEAVVVSGGGISVNEVPMGVIDLLNQESQRVFV